MMSRTLILSLFVSLAVSPSSWGLTLTNVGTHYDVGGTFFPGGSPPYVVVPWRYEVNSKPLDADGNNVYGSAGYALFATQFNWPNIECCGSSVPFDDNTYPNLIQLPSFVSDSAPLVTNKVGGWNYALVDDPTLVNGPRDYNWGDTQIPPVESISNPPAPNSQGPYIKLGILDGNDVFNNDPQTSPVGAARWAFEVGEGVPSSFRVGVITDGLDGEQWAATEVLFAQVSDQTNDIVGLPVTTGSLERNRYVDIHFFDVIDAQPGDQFAILAKASSDGFGAISGVVFDTFSTVLPGDFNGDGKVDALDYVVWRNNLEQDESVLNGAGDNSGTVDIGDYTLWRDEYAPTSGGSLAIGAQVPEPASYLAIASSMFLVWRLRPKK
jgi:hypothetical protein